MASKYDVLKTESPFIDFPTPHMVQILVNAEFWIVSFYGF